MRFLDIMYICEIYKNMDEFDFIQRCIGFQWDKSNYPKNWEKHGVSASECEQIFFNRPLISATDVKHSEKEQRHFAMGQTDSGRLLFVVFTIREDRIRVISSRDMNRNERKVYERS